MRSCPRCGQGVGSWSSGARLRGGRPGPLSVAGRVRRRAGVYDGPRTVTFQGRHPETGAAVALTVFKPETPLSEEDVRGLRAEADELMAVRHPAVPATLVSRRRPRASTSASGVGGRAPPVRPGHHRRARRPAAARGAAGGDRGRARRDARGRALPAVPRAEIPGRAADGAPGYRVRFNYRTYASSIAPRTIRRRASRGC